MAAAAISATMLQGVDGVTEGDWSDRDEAQYRDISELMQELIANPARRDWLKRGIRFRCTGCLPPISTPR